MKMTAIILAGGKSSRMGQDKALLEFGGKTILENLVDFSSSFFNETLIVVNQGKKLSGLDLKKSSVHEDLIPESGPLAGLYTGLVYSKNLLSCVLTCDMPFVDDLVIRKLVEHEEAGYDVICLETEGDDQPFPGIYRRSSRSLIKSLLESGEKSMKRFLQIATVKWIELEIERKEALINLNYMEDYHRALEQKDVNRD